MDDRGGKHMIIRDLLPIGSVVLLENGEPMKIWWDANGDLCIEYESGEWYHYNQRGEWW